MRLAVTGFLVFSGYLLVVSLRLIMTCCHILQQVFHYELLLVFVVDVDDWYSARVCMRVQNSRYLQTAHLNFLLRQT